jgi:acetolactate decarboxylase
MDNVSAYTALMRTLLLLGLILLAGCASTPNTGVYQNSTIDALLDGNYDGEVTFGELRQHGDFGLGTFDAVDGEMIELDGQFFQARSDGHVLRVGDDVRTPFSAVTFFRARSRKRLDAALGYRDLQAILDTMRPVNGHAYAFRIDGRFASVKVRSVGRQGRPYPPLAEVVKTQSVTAMKDVEGTLVGFWFPESLRHMNVPGYHFHFITNDRSAGGHVLDLALANGEAAMQALDTLTVALPRAAPTTRRVDDRLHELEKVEK